jgi:hypothetical protein
MEAPQDQNTNPFFWKLHGPFSQCEIVLVLLSHDLYHSISCFHEIKAAMAAENVTTIIPVRIEVALPEKEDQWPRATGVGIDRQTVQDHLKKLEDEGGVSPFSRTTLSPGNTGGTLMENDPLLKSLVTMISERLGENGNQGYLIGDRREQVDKVRGMHSIVTVQIFALGFLVPI